MRLIDADATIEDIKRQTKMLHVLLPEADELTNELEKGFVAQIQKMPTIDPTKHGHWIGRYFPYKCSECGKMNDSKDNFCWNCGADMREEK